jgi:hypothetical protein
MLRVYSGTNRTALRDWATVPPAPEEEDRRDFGGCRTPAPEEVVGAVEVAEGNGEGDVPQHTARRCRIRCHTGEDVRSLHRT